MRAEIGKHIVIDTEICHGKPTFKGTRVLVSDVIELLAAGEPVERIVKSYPGLNREMIREALEYAARLAREGAYVEFPKVSA